jgi:hypothetical protein
VFVFVRQIWRSAGFNRRNPNDDTGSGAETMRRLLKEERIAWLTASLLAIGDFLTNRLATFTAFRSVLRKLSQTSLNAVNVFFIHGPYRILEANNTQNRKKETF